MVAGYVKDFLDHHTIRSTFCHILVSSASSSRCNSCNAYRKVLNSMVSRQLKEKVEDGTQTNSHTNFRYLNTPNKYYVCNSNHH